MRSRARTAAPKRRPIDESPIAVPASARAVLRTPGQPLDPATRRFLEPRLGHDFSRVRVHTDEQAAASAREVNALAYTVGADIVFDSGEYAPDTAEGRALLVHELGHVAEQGVIAPHQLMRREKGRRKDVPSSFLSSLAPDTMTEYLDGKSIERLELQQALSGPDPLGADSLITVADPLREFVRLHALQLMAAHRQHVRQTEQDTVFSGQRALREQSRAAAAMHNLREAGTSIAALNESKAKIEDFAEQIHDIRVSANLTHSHGNPRERIADFVRVLGTAERFDVTITADLLESFQFSMDRLHGLSNNNYLYWGFLRHAADQVNRTAQRQLAAVKIATSRIYEAYPLYAALDVELIAGGGMQDDDALRFAAVKAFGDVIARIDAAIRRIADDSIDPFALPMAVDAAREELPEALHVTLDKARRHYELKNLATMVGLSVLELGAVFVPVIGPALSTAIGVANLGLQVDDIFDRAVLADAATDPYHHPLDTPGVMTFEVVAAVIGAILLAAGAGAAVFSWAKAAKRKPPTDLTEATEPLQPPKQLEGRSADTPETEGGGHIPLESEPAPASAQSRRAQALDAARRAASALEEAREIMRRVVINNQKLSPEAAEEAAQMFVRIDREVAEAAAGHGDDIKGFYIPASQGDVVDLEWGGELFVGHIFEGNGGAFPKGRLVVLGKEASEGLSPRGQFLSRRCVVRHEVGEMLEFDAPLPDWRAFQKGPYQHWRSSTRGALLNRTTREEQIALLRDARFDRVSPLPEGVGRPLAKRLGIEREVYE